jgi:hypothetical protein
MPRRKSFELRPIPIETAVSDTRRRRTDSPAHEDRGRGGVESGKRLSRKNSSGATGPGRPPLFCALGLNVATAYTGPGRRAPNRFAG